MHIVNATFLTSATGAAKWPTLDRPEAALCGRSNVGKSTLLNALLQRKGLARVSRTPGRTQLLNFFTVTVADPNKKKTELVIADLPGFGYAQLSRSVHAAWRPMMEQYLTERRPLRAVALLCDGRRAAAADAAELLFEELELAHFLREQGRIVVPVLTKADKLSKHERKPAALLLQQLFGQRVTIVSGQTGEGMDELWRRLLRAVDSGPGDWSQEPTYAERRDDAAAHSAAPLPPRDQGVNP